MDEKLLKAIGKKFPVMNVIPSIGKKGRAFTTVEREIAKHLVTLEIGISNVYVIDVKKLEN